jgi:DNA-directed RNA polymerase specialized sigma24 family protein
VRTETVVTALDGAAALARLYDAAARPLHGYLARRVGVEIADDLVAEAFLVLREQRDRVDLAGDAARP